MPLPPEKRIRFFVFVIESPSAADLYHRRSEGEIIQKAVELNDIGCVVKTAICLQAFEACLKIGLMDAMKDYPGCLPILHISAHGSKDGIQLSDGAIIRWHELKDHLRPINESLGNLLVVCMSSCEGYAGITMAMYPEDKGLPFFALVGCPEMPTWAETAVAYATLYHQLHRGEFIDDAVKAMRIASGRSTFWVQHAAVTRQQFIDNFVATIPQEAQESLEHRLLDEPPENQAKLKLLVSGNP